MPRQQYSYIIYAIKLKILYPDDIKLGELTP